MGSLLQRLTSSNPVVSESRAGAVRLYPTWGRTEDPPFGNFQQYAELGFGSNAVVFAAIQVRQRFMSEIEFKFQNLSDRRLFGSPLLTVLERPWPGGTTQDLVARLEQDSSIAGNAYVHRTPSGLQRLRPDWVSIITDGFRPFGYRYEPPGGEPVVLPVEDVAHYAPIPDPEAPFRGMSWLSPVAKEIMSDRAMEEHRNRYFRNAATPNMIVKVEQALSADDRQVLEQAISRKYESVENAYKTMVVDRGADVTVVGNTMVDMQFADVQGAAEVRIASAAGVPPQLLGTQLGLKSSTFTNYTQAFRFFVDGTIRPLWRNMAGSLESVVDVPAGARLWYDDRHVPALQQDAQDEASIYDLNSRTIGALIRAGFAPDAAVDAVNNSDLSVLSGAHLGFLPTTLQPDEGDGPQVAVGGVADEDTAPSDPEVNG